MLTDFSVVITAQHTNVTTPQGTPQTSAGLVPAMRPYSCGGRPRGKNRASTKAGDRPLPKAAWRLRPGQSPRPPTRGTRLKGSGTGGLSVRRGQRSQSALRGQSREGAAQPGSAG